MDIKNNVNDAVNNGEKIEKIHTNKEDTETNQNDIENNIEELKQDIDETKENNDETTETIEDNQESNDYVDTSPGYEYSNIELYEDYGEFFIYDRYSHNKYKIDITNYLINCNSNKLEEYLDDVYEDIKYELGENYLSSEHFKWTSEHMVKLTPFLIRHVNYLQEAKKLGPLKKAIVLEMMYSLIQEFVEDDEKNMELQSVLKNIIPNVIDLVCKASTQTIDIGKYPKNQNGILRRIWKYFF